MYRSQIALIKYCTKFSVCLCVLMLAIYPTHIHKTLASQMPYKTMLKLSEDDMCLAWVIHDEARGESLKGARAVMDVVLKRMKTRKLSACDVIAQPRQFSGYSKKSLKNIPSKTLTRYIKVRNMEAITPEAEYFHSSSVKPAWARKFKVVANIGNHVFYKEK